MSTSDAAAKARRRAHQSIIRAAKTGNVHVLAQRCARYPDCMDLPDEDGNVTAMHYAAGGGHDAAVRLLHELGSGAIDARDNLGKTPMRYAVDNGLFSTVMLLFDLGSRSLEVADAFSVYPFHRIMAAQRFDVFRYFFERQPALVRTFDAFGENFMHYAASFNSKEFLVLLQRYGNDSHFEKSARRVVPAHKFSYFGCCVRRFYFSRSLTETLFFSSDDAVA